MKKLLMTALVALFAAMPLTAAGEYFPRDIFAYGQVSNAQELRTFLDVANLTAGDLHMRPESEQFTRTINLMKAATEGLISAEFAIVNLEFGGRGGEPRPQMVGLMKFDRNITYVEIIEKITGEEFDKAIKENAEMAAKEYGGAQYFGDNEDDVVIGVKNTEVFFAMKQADFEDMVDASNGTKPAEDLLSSNSRFNTWSGSASGTIGGWMDLTKIRGYVERANGVMSDEEKRREGENPEGMPRPRRNNEFENILEASKAWEWDKLDTASISLSAGGRNNGRIEITYKEPISYARALPSPTTFTSYKYLPETTALCGGISLPNLRSVADVLIEQFREARQLALLKDPEGLKDRNVFGERMERAENVFRDLREMMGIGFLRVAKKLSEQGHTAPWSGSAKDLNQIVKEPALIGEFMTYSITSIENLHFAGIGKEHTGIIKFSSPRGRDITLDISRMRTEYGEGEASKRDMNIAELIEGGVKALEFTAGFSLSDASSMLGSHVVGGMAIDRLGARFGGSRRLLDGSGAFGILSLSDTKKLEERLANLVTLFPQPEVANMLLTADGKKFITRYQHKNARFIFGTPEICFTLTRDALLVAGPSVTAQMLSPKRPMRIINRSGMAPQGSMCFTLDLEQFVNPVNVDDMPFFPMPRNVENGRISGHWRCDLNATSMVIEGTQPFSKLKELTTIESDYDERRRTDLRGLSAFRDVANVIYQERLADDSEGNDVFPSLSEAIARYKVDQAKEEVDDSGRRREKYYRSIWHDDVERSRIFDGPLASHWEFFQSRRVVAEYLGAYDEIIAVSHPLANGRRYLATASSYYSVSAAAYKRIIELRDASLATEAPVTIERFNEFKMDDLEAAFALEPLWEQRFLNRIRQRYSSSAPDEGEAMSDPEYGEARFEVVEEALVKVRISGYGHWAVYDSQFGLVDASWLQDDKD